MSAYRPIDLADVTVAMREVFEVADNAKIQLR